MDENSPGEMTWSRWDMCCCTSRVARCLWQGLKAATEEKNEFIKQKKLTMPVTELCEGLPREFATYISYTRSLGFKDRPDYAYLRRLFGKAFSARGFRYDNRFEAAANPPAHLLMPGNAAFHRHGR
ncbi:casein kinase 1 epsilon [Beauveria bassiana ARSEF 2860]|uniref:Casein kinase 1 epsilon n=1 Tax=Beauveria bassiana (strain ARSEF 2860) TaxID=655819 RepID=J4KLD9_BEAB2|nr:casein kinase 1 epsilon [Beauveria bassiana ARSEF 2860]EJP62034.1 casein kinase 1 epsilon [Beauveria bassiana ARSEF 2860]